MSRQHDVPLLGRNSSGGPQDNIVHSAGDEELKSDIRFARSAALGERSEDGTEKYRLMDNDVSFSGEIDDEDPQEWHVISDLDSFFQRMYTYYSENGYVCIVVSRVLHLLRIAFTVGFSAILLVYVDWPELQKCSLGEFSCRDVSILVDHPFEHFTTLRVLVLLYLIVFGLYWLWHVFRLAVDLREYSEMKYFFNVQLDIRESDISAVSWSEVVRRTVKIQDRIRLCVVKDKLTVHDIINRTMRKENYLIALLNKDLLDLRIPLPFLRETQLLTKSVEWNLYFAVLDAMFDDDMCLRRSFVENPAALRRRFFVLGIINFILAPFLVVFVLIYFVLKNAEKFHRDPSQIGARGWSPIWLWRFREFNELPHAFERRIARSYKFANLYLRQFPNKLHDITINFFIFIIGSFAAVLIVLGFVNEALLSITIGDRNLWWYIALFGTILALSRGLVARDTEISVSPDTALEKLAIYTRYLPKRWHHRGAARDVRAEFAQMYQYKIITLTAEVLGVLATPLVLWFSLPRSAEALLRFIRDYTVSVEGVGDVCGFALFDFARHGNPHYGSPQDAPKAARSRQGKMEKSFVSFKATYPFWDEGAARSALLASLYADEAAAAATRRPPADADAPPPSSSLPSTAAAAAVPPSDLVLVSTRGSAVPSQLETQILSGGRGDRPADAIVDPMLDPSLDVAESTAARLHTWMGRYYRSHVYLPARAPTASVGARSNTISGLGNVAESTYMDPR